VCVCVCVCVYVCVCVRVCVPMNRSNPGLLLTLISTSYYFNLSHHLNYLLDSFVVDPSSLPLSLSLSIHSSIHPSIPISISIYPSLLPFPFNYTTLLLMKHRSILVVNSVKLASVDSSLPNLVVFHYPDICIIDVFG
jgi:hypothetical protein